jgi:hypothetical protein
VTVLRRCWPLKSVSVATALLLVVAASCSSVSSTRPAAAEDPQIGVPIRLVRCTDWNQATVEERHGTIRRLKSFAGGPVVGGGANPAHGTGAVLEDEQAYDLLSNTCKQSYARAFKLYKIYERGASFAGHR